MTLLFLIAGISLFALLAKHGPKVHKIATTMFGTGMNRMVTSSDPGSDAEGQETTPIPKPTLMTKFTAKLRRRRPTGGDVEQAGGNGTGAGGDIEISVRDDGSRRGGETERRVRQRQGIA
jgi:hypothetical protein